MAKRKPTTTETRTFTAQGIPLRIPVKYREGHVLTAGEAASLNQTYVENVRNNIRPVLQDWAKEKKPNLPTMAQQLVDEYVERYQMGVRRRRGGPKLDPALAKAEEAAARSLAIGRARERAMAAGQTPKQAALRKEAEAVLADPEAGPRIRQAARRMVRLQQQVQHL
jgi:hypothetical protein